MAGRRVQYCGECFEQFDAELAQCPRCGAAPVRLSERDYGRKLVHALEHPLADIRMRAILALGLRCEADAAAALAACALRSPADIVAGLEIVNSLARILSAGGEPAALERLAATHPAHAVQVAARRVLDDCRPASSCPFCTTEGLILHNELAGVRFDKSPVTPGHCLIIPFRHVADFFATTGAEREAMLLLADEAKAMLDQAHSPAGYNLGINVGTVAGQTIPHVHLHLIPRYPGDVDNPRGGVRGVIPARQNY